LDEPLSRRMPAFKRRVFAGNIKVGRRYSRVSHAVMEGENNAISVQTILTILSQFSSVDSMRATSETDGAPGLRSIAVRSSGAFKYKSDCLPNFVNINEGMHRTASGTSLEDELIDLDNFRKHIEVLQANIDVLDLGLLKETRKAPRCRSKTRLLRHPHSVVRAILQLLTQQM
jgi:hypothetical protein